MKKIKGFLLFLACLALANISSAGTLVQFQIYFSFVQAPAEVDVEMFDKDKPITVKNFLELIETGAYQLGLFHRLVPGFVLQGGGFNVLTPFATNAFAPPFPGLLAVNNFGNITNEFKVGPFHSNTNWTIAMAKTSDPNSANSQFFFNLANNASSLDSTNNAGGFTVFGHVVRGTNTLIFFNQFFNGFYLQDLTKAYGSSGFFTQLPTADGTNLPPYFDLVGFTVTVLNARVTVAPNGARRIIWNSVSGVTNNIEFATNIPPVWHVLASPVGTGNVMTNIDSTANVTRRFYRVHPLF